ncbi:MAG: cyclic nucleotide-binding domain-containing protein [Alphaproteobacteria bacterium]|nr:cyclic nucleotide-binding domain-containing protein [Alphaproteobacteria bacterium]
MIHSGPQASNQSIDQIGYLAKSALGAGLTADELCALASKVELRKLVKNEVLISEGQEDDHLYAVAKGTLGISRDDMRGGASFGTLKAGMIFGELAFLAGLKRTATVKAEADDCWVIALRRKQLESLLMEYPQLVYKVMCSVIRSACTTVNNMDGTYVDLLHYIHG